MSEYTDLKILANNLKKENKQLRGLLQQANNDCKVAQESLDGSEKRIEELEDMLREYDLGEGDI